MIHVACRSAFTFSILPFRLIPCGNIHFPIGIKFWQSNGKAKKFDCVFYRSRPLSLRSSTAPKSFKD